MYSQQTSSHLQPIRQKLNQIEKIYSNINHEITTNLKQYDDLILEKKQTFETIQRNLQDLKSVYEKDIDKFQENVDKGILYNESLYGRVQKDLTYLSKDQDLLKKKLGNLEKRVDEMERQIGNMNYSL